MRPIKKIAMIGATGMLGVPVSIALMEAGFEVTALQGLGIDAVGQAQRVGPDDLVALGQRVFAAAPGAEGILISCGGLRTLGVTVPLEAACGVPVVSSTPAAYSRISSAASTISTLTATRARARSGPRSPCTARKAICTW